jgi:signal transduction histidine kinase
MPTEQRLRRLKRVAILAPAVSMLALVSGSHLLAGLGAKPWLVWFATISFVLVGIVAFTEWIFRIIWQQQAELAQQNAELHALHEAGLAIAADLDLDRVLAQVVEQARRLIGSRYGLLVMCEQAIGPPIVLTSGLAAGRECRLAEISSHGLLDQVLRDGHVLRIDDLYRYPGERHFPEGHVTMRRLLGVPIRSGEQVLGALYLADRVDGHPYSLQDQLRLERFATQAALAITNARLHRRITCLAIAEERERIAREMHDSLAQVLGYVLTKASAARELLGQVGRVRDAEQLLRQLEQAAREAYADVREGILGLRTALDPSHPLLRTLERYVERWQEQSGIAVNLVVEPAGDAVCGLSPIAELQLLRIVQEALTNVRKHAQARHVTVQIGKTSESVTVAISDDGIGFDSEAHSPTGYPRFGLATMRERAEAVGGTLAIRSQPGRGTTVDVALPLQRHAPVPGGHDAHLDR